MENKYNGKLTLEDFYQFCDDLEIILVNTKSDMKLTSLKELYPSPFKL